MRSRSPWDWRLKALLTACSSRSYVSQIQRIPLNLLQESMGLASQSTAFSTQLQELCVPNTAHTAKSAPGVHGTGVSKHHFQHAAPKYSAYR